ncbi:sugar phosphate isomerase/epimerase [Entomomonas sp. E2T0]|uniref:sugar phosphate isomerase/epimerase family protein n=1 Tax=Entomomonas sp. E2T0 TaxID=2930213 RepID=UPI00222838BB|nr:sugar phosphate isomerase/epimerase [Entomomonas sp. E2T0]UYZ83929.1 sugar phosphate isomerase/epimerase [Entomomonas sp. E2T0]
MRKLSLAALTVLELTPPEMIDCAQQAGYDCVGLRLIPATPNEPAYDFKGDTPIRRECLARLKQSDVKVEDIEILRITEHVDIQAFEAIFETAKLLGARSALVAADDKNETRLIDNLGLLAELSAQYDILPHVEFMPWLSTATLKDAVTLVNKVNQSNLSVLVDSIHFHRSHSNTADWSSYRGTMPRYIQLCDVPTKEVKNMDEIITQARSQRKAPGEGYITNLADIISMLPTETAISLEIPEKDRANEPALTRAKRLHHIATTWLAEHHLG